MQGILHYNTDLFDKTTAQRMLGHFLVSCLPVASLCNDRLREASHDLGEQGFSLCEGCGNTLSLFEPHACMACCASHSI